MAGAGIKLWATADTVTATEFQTYLQEQVVAVFDDTSARDAAFGGAGEPTLTEGMSCYLKDTNEFQIYSGSAWVALLDLYTISVSSGNYTMTADLTVGGGDLSIGSTAAGETLNIAGVTTTSGAGSSLKIKGGDATGTNQGGNWLILQPGLGTGTGVSGDILFYTGPAGSSGASQNTATKAMTITSAQEVVMEDNLTVKGYVDMATTSGGYLTIGAGGGTTEGGELRLVPGSSGTLTAYIDTLYASSTDFLRLHDGTNVMFQWDLTNRKLRFNDASVYNIYSNSDNLFLNCAAGSAHYVRVNDTTAMNINSTGVSIGNGDTGASAALDVTGTMEQDAVVGRIAPTGVVLPFAGGSIPAGWLLCAGTAVSRTTYAHLFAVIGTTYGVGDGSTTFNIPNMQGRVPAGVNTADSDFVSLNTQGGAATVTLTSSEMPSHTHTQNSHTHPIWHTAYGYLGTVAGTFGAIINRDAIGNNVGGLWTATATTATNQNTGGGGAHSNLQPYISLYYIIAT